VPRLCRGFDAFKAAQTFADAGKKRIAIDIGLRGKQCVEQTCLR
jgi:hypothetical protein